MANGGSAPAWQGLPEEQHDDAFDGDALQAAIERQRREEFRSLTQLNLSWAS